MRAGVAQDGVISPVLFTLYVNNIQTPSFHVELAEYEDDTSGNTKLQIKYLEIYIIALRLSLRERRIAIIRIRVRHCCSLLHGDTSRPHWLQFSRKGDPMVRNSPI